MAATWKKIAFEEDVLLKSIIAAKGDLIVGSANDTATVLSIGTDGYVLKVSTDTPAWVDPATLAVADHASTHKNSGSDELLLSDFGEPTADVEFNGQEALNFCLQNSASPPATAVLGKLYYDTDDNCAYICTAVA